MLNSIKNFDKKTREGILSEIALEFGRPSFEGNYSFEYNSAEVAFDENNAESLFKVFKKTWGEPEDVRLLTLTEIFQRLKLKDSEQFQYAKMKVLDFIGREIRELALNTTHISRARKRLGQKGILSPNAYQIKFAEEFIDVCGPLGISKKEVNQAVNFPDMYEHFFPEIQENTEAISLYAKLIPNGADPYTLLVDAHRVGDVLYVHFAIRAYHSDIDVSCVATPTDLLRKITEKYGSEISIGSQKGNLILNETIKNGSFQISYKNEYRKRRLTRGSTRKLANGDIEICLAYCVDINSYAEALRQHGNKVDAEF